MGKCVSRPTSDSIINSSWESTTGNSDYFIAVSDKSFIFLIDEDEEDEGQSESKKKSKQSGPETKGTAMSFGFKKKLYTSSSSSTQKKNANPKEKEKENCMLTDDKYRNNLGTVISNPAILKTDNGLMCSDDNGNTGSMDSLNERTETGRTTPRLAPPRKESTGAPYRSIRFGFRQANAVRPASVGLNPKVTCYDGVTNNNFIAKPRSKSASSSSRSSIAPTSKQNVQNNNNKQQVSAAQQQQNVKRENPKISSVSTTVNISYQQQQQNMPEMQINITDYTNKPPSGKHHNQYTVVNTGMHTNEIVRPTPQPAASVVESEALVSKFTLHTSSLPKLQFPVPISLTPRYAMDTKVAKQVANNTRRGGFQGPRDISTDSGISSSIDNYFANDSSCNYSPRRNRPRNLEMVINGRHKFEVRDLEDSLSDESAVVPLSLPKLPSVFNNSCQPASLSGLHRNEYSSSAANGRNDHQNRLTNTNQYRSSPTDGIHLNFRKSSLTSLDVDESIEEEKLYRDNSVTEKCNKNVTIKECSPSSKNSSPASSRASWCNAGESLAFKDCSSISVSSSESMHNNRNAGERSVTFQDEDISSIAITDGHSFLSSLSTPSSNNVTHNKSKSRRTDEALSIVIEDMKFAQITAAAGNDFLDDETSPTDSLVSCSTDSDEVISKRNKKKINDSIKEKDIDDNTPIMDISSPLSPGTPTHASNSLSLSDGGRDFLIDDEIADQPALCFTDNNDIIASNQHLYSLTDTPTLIETASTKSNKSRSKHSPVSKAISNNSYAPQVKPRHSLLSRTESLDTLSPCESIASDDLMMDFECHSSIDSIDRISQSNHSGSGSALHTLDETQLWSELEAQGGEVLREWSTLLRSTRQTSRDQMRSQLPARATRLLNRSRIQHSNNGSDSPRSLDSFQRRTPSARPSPQFGSRGDSNSSDDNLFMLDKSLRNTMIQDVLLFKKQLIQLRSILQEPDEECLTRTDTLNPFEINNGQFFGTGCNFDSNMYFENKDLYNYSTAAEQEAAAAAEAKHELSDLRRQVVYLQSQIDDKDRTIRIQQNLIDKLETEVDRANAGSESSHSIQQIDTMNTATQTERLRPLSMGPDGLTSRSDDEAEWSSSASPTPSTASSSKTNNSSNSFPLKKSSSSTIQTKQQNGYVKTIAFGTTTKTIPRVSSKSQNNSNHLPIIQINNNNLSNGNGNHVQPKSDKSNKISLNQSPTSRRIPRLIKTSTINGGEANNLNGSAKLNSSRDADILNVENGFSETNHFNHNFVNRNNKQNIHNNSSVKLRNNLNVLKSTNFANSTAKSDDDF